MPYNFVANSFYTL